MRARWLLPPTALVLVASGCAYTPGEVEARRANGYAMAQGAHDQILADTDRNYAREMHAAQEWNMPSLFGLPAQAVTVIAILALAVIAVVGVAWAVAHYKLGEARAMQNRRAGEEREKQITERRRLDTDTATLLAQAHDCPTCGATPQVQLASQRASTATEDAQ